MEAAFAWVHQIWEFIVSLIPHVGLLRATHGGVKFKRGGRAVPLTPGLFWYLPLTTDVVTVPVKRQTVSLEPQTLTTIDDYTVVVAATVVYEINDVLKALVDTYDLDDTVGDVAQRGVLQVVGSREFNDLRDHLTDEVPKELKAACRKDLRQFGVLVKDAFLAECAVVTAYRVIGGHSVLPHETEQ